MFNDTQAIRAYFFKLGLASEIADIYLALHAYGPQSISDLARHSGVERTRIYRLAGDMQASSLIEVEVEYKKSIYRAAPIANLQVLISKKEQEVRDLQIGFGQLNDSLNALHDSSATRIQHHKGVDGLKQMYWNQTRGSTENLSILYENMQNRTNLAFFERWARLCNERGIQFRGIINDNFIKTQQDWYGKHSNERLASWQSRYLPDSVFLITHSVVIYDDITAYYNWKDGEIFGIEIYNQEIADSQRQFFEMLWTQSLPVDDLKGLNGASSERT
jgi:hypothetical protein